MIFDHRQVDPGAFTTVARPLAQKDDTNAVLASLQPKSEAQKHALAKAQQFATAMQQSRLLLSLQIAGPLVPWQLVVIVAFWAAALFFGYGLLAPNNAAIIIALALAAVSIGNLLALSIEASTQPRHKLAQTKEIHIVFGGMRHDRWAALLEQQPPLCPLSAAQTRRNHSGRHAVGAADAGSSSRPGLWTGSAFAGTNNRPDHPGKTRVGTDAANPGTNACAGANPAAAHSCTNTCAGANPAADPCTNTCARTSTDAAGSNPGARACANPAAAHSCTYACTSTDATGSNPGAPACADPAAAHSCAYTCTSTDATGSNSGARACTDPAAPGPDSYTSTGAGPAHACARACPDTAAPGPHTHACARANPADATTSPRADAAASSSHTRAAARSRSSWTRTGAAAYGKRVAPEAQYGNERKACRAAPRSSHRLHARHVRFS
ncbi:MAG TPA: hypothetical protein VG124_13390 [Beijerinckiaceae bacterium]|nr:hypothetical protein [Beijerinckiaceae bacterium]